MWTILNAQIHALDLDFIQKEIQEVNRIVLWVTYGREWFDLDEMDAMPSMNKGARSDLPGSPFDVIGSETDK